VVAVRLEAGETADLVVAVAVAVAVATTRRRIRMLQCHHVVLPQATAG
jgi:hypothetical protein